MILQLLVTRLMQHLLGSFNPGLGEKRGPGGRLLMSSKINLLSVIASSREAGEGGERGGGWQPHGWYFLYTKSSHYPLQKNNLQRIGKELITK